MKDSRIECLYPYLPHADLTNDGYVFLTELMCPPSGPSGEIFQRPRFAGCAGCQKQPALIEKASRTYAAAINIVGDLSC